MANPSQSVKIRQITRDPSINNQPFKQDSISSLLNLTKNKSLFSKSPSPLIGRSKSKFRNKEINEENCRLVARIIQIKERKAKKQTKYQVITSNKMQNPERTRRIQLQNQRLGRSLVMIKSGKTLQRIKTQIAQQILKIADTSCSRRMTTSQSLSQNLFFDCTLTTLARGNNSTLSDSWNKSIDIDSIPRRRKKEQPL